MLCAPWVAVTGFSSSLRREVLSSGLPLRVSSVQPGPVRSPFATVRLHCIYVCADLLAVVLLQ